MTGYIKLYRKLWDNKLWFSEPFTRAQAWVDLLLLANHKCSIIFIRGHKIDLVPGQLAWSVKSLAERWQWSEGKVNRFLDVLKTERQIESKPVAVTTVITILLYNEYQADGAQNRALAERGQSAGEVLTERRQRANGARAETDNNDKNVSNDMNDKHVKNDEHFFSEKQKNSFEKFKEWINVYAPNVGRMKEPFTIAQYLKITGQATDENGNPVKGFPQKALGAMLKRMHNYARLNEKNVSAYYTLLNWFRREQA